MLTIISGGQTGVDRAALDTAIEIGLPYRGWCPRGGWAEDYPEPPGLLHDYPDLWPTPQTNPSQRTIWNVQGSDAVLALTHSDLFSRGTELAISHARYLGRPYLIADIDQGSQDIEVFLTRLVPLARLNIVGPRQSQVDDIYQQSYQLLLSLLEA